MAATHVQYMVQPLDNFSFDWRPLEELTQKRRTPSQIWMLLTFFHWHVGLYLTRSVCQQLNFRIGHIRSHLHIGRPGRTGLSKNRKQDQTRFLEFMCTLREKRGNRGGTDVVSVEPYFWT
jgi:hypothetical protein